MLIALAIALPLGVLSAIGHRRATGAVISTLSQLGIAIPAFWTGLMLIDTLLSDEKGSFIDAVKHLILPTIVLGTVPLAIIARMTRSAMLEVLGEDYIRTARAKGLSTFRVIAIHALRNALVTVVTVIGLQVGVLLGGAILTENVFSWPGIAKWLVESIGRRDYPALQGGVLIIATLVMAVNLLVDLLYGLLNPRIRHRR
jgi:dipeptide transport system permease protein